MAPGFETALRNVPGLLDVNSDLQIKNPELAVTLDREQIAALGLTVDQVELGAVVSVWIATDLADLRARRRIPGDHAGRAAVPAGSRGALDALRAGAGQQARSALGGRHDPPERRPAVGQPYRPAAVGHALVQHRAWRGARRRRRARRAARARDAAEHGVGELPGHGAGVPGFDARPRLGPAARHLRHLRRARHPVRELHSPDHDSHGTPLRRLRRAADAAASSSRT